MPQTASLADLVTDRNQQVHCTILSAKCVDGDTFDVKVELADGSELAGEMFSPGGRVPKKDEEFTLTLTDQKEVATVVPVLDKAGKDTGKTVVEMQERPVVTGYPM